MNKVLVHPTTKRQLDSIVDHPPHAVMLTGKSGSGKSTLALQLAARLLVISEDKLASHPYVMVIDPGENVISIDEIRRLQQFLKLKVPAKYRSGIQRAVLVMRIERMRPEAQNALLKTLEEPPAGTSIIMTSDHPELLLSTIPSRAQNVSVLPVDEKQARDFYKKVDETVFSRAYALSGGHAGLLDALLNQPDHVLVQDVERAKSILKLTPGERLMTVDELAKDKQAVQHLLDALLRVTHAGLHGAAKHQTTSVVAAWNRRHQAVFEAIVYMQKNTNTKLVLDSLFLNI